MRTSKALIRGASVVTGLGMGLAMGCLNVRPDPNHCSNLDGDRTCEERYPGERTFCAWGTCGPTPGEDGCVAERPADDACYSPCGDGARFDDDASCLVDTSSSSGEESTSTGEETGTESGSSESSTTGPMPCVDNGDCPDAAAPLCEPSSGECVTCDAFGAEADAACAGLDPMAPLCVSGTCVACTPENPIVCDDQLLLCDGGTNSCVPCTEHGQCGSGACELAVGRCFPDDFVVHVDGDPTAMPMPDYTSINAAVDAVDDGTHGVIIVHELDGAGSYQTAGMGLRINGGKTVALLAAPGEGPILQGTNMNPGLRVEGAGTVVYMDGLRLRNGDVQGLLVDGAFAWVDRSRIVQNTGGGVLAQGGAELTLRNCFVGRNGDQFADTRGITASDAMLRLVYDTIAANEGTGASGPVSVACDGATSGEVRNSIVAAGDDTIACAGVSFSFNVVDTNGLAGSDNDVLSFDPGWFPNIAMSDFHIGMGPPFADVARWQTDDPATDIDGGLRPTVDGTADYAGADVP